MPDDDGWPLLHMAIQQAQTDSVALLLAHGAGLDIRTRRDNWTAWDVLLDLGRPECSHPTWKMKEVRDLLDFRALSKLYRRICFQCRWIVVRDSSVRARVDNPGRNGARTYRALYADWKQMDK